MLKKILNGTHGITERAFLMKAILTAILVVSTLIVGSNQFDKFISFRWEMTAQNLRNEAIQDCFNTALMTSDEDEEMEIKINDDIYNRCIAEKGYNK